MYGRLEVPGRTTMLWALLACGTVACGDDSLAGPELSRVSIDFAGDGTLAPDPDAGVIDCLLPDGGVAIVLPSAFVADQEYTLLGRTRGDIVVTRCRVDPVSGKTVLDGQVVHTGERGDAMMADYELALEPTGQFLLEAVVTGGTGQLRGARGDVSGSGTLDPGTGMGQFSLSGVITLPGT